MQNPPPPSLTTQIERRYGGSQFRLDPTLSLYYFWMNTAMAPFYDVRVRRAVNYAIDPQILQAIYGGQVVPTQQVLPPGMSGYRKFELYPHDLSIARKLIAKARPRDRKITVWTDSEAPNTEATIYYAQVLRELGFEVRLKVLSADNYFSVIGNLSTPDLDTGWSDWFEDTRTPMTSFSLCSRVKRSSGATTPTSRRSTYPHSTAGSLGSGSGPGSQSTAMRPSTGDI
jgi:peptide/nickel transport system substrate-binding protein